MTKTFKELVRSEKYPTTLMAVILFAIWFCVLAFSSDYTPNRIIDEDPRNIPGDIQCDGKSCW